MRKVGFFVAFWLANTLSFFCVPFLIVTAVFTRRYAIPSLFTEDELEQLDDDGTAVDGEGAAAAPAGLRRATSEAARTGAFGAFSSVQTRH